MSGDPGCRAARQIGQLLESPACVRVAGLDGAVERLPVEQIHIREGRPQEHIGELALRGCACCAVDNPAYMRIRKIVRRRFPLWAWSAPTSLPITSPGALRCMTSTGRLLMAAPSTNILSPRNTGGMTPGMATDARNACASGPARCSNALPVVKLALMQKNGLTQIFDVGVAVLLLQ